jgi:radical SAM protein with 4Fe4S-binding SPASM domain
VPQARRWPLTATRDELLRRFDVHQKPRPAYVVWELTLACDQRCLHCGSRAAEARPNELTTAQALEVVAQLAELKTFEVVLIGGEAYLHPGFLDVVRALKAQGIRPSMTTGGRGITHELARAMTDAGMHSVSVSVDGLRDAHDLFRAQRGGFDAATRALEVLRDAGLRIAANTNFHWLNLHDAEALYEHLRGLGVRAWQLILTVPLGRAADRPGLLLQPWDLLTLMPVLAKLKRRGWEEGVQLQLSNNLGYFGPDEALLRAPTPEQPEHFHGCQAGKLVMGIESDGAVKGCPSLQSSHYIGGSLQDQRLEALWQTKEVTFARRRTVEDLWGFCRTCPFAETCLGGCTYSAHSLFGRPGNNPYCHYRARALAAEGKRERLVPKQAAPGKPFDNGLFEIVIEPFDAPDVRAPARLAARKLALSRSA